MLIRLISIYVLITSGTAFGQDPVVIKVENPDSLKVSSSDSLEVAGFVNEVDSSAKKQIGNWISVGYETSLVNRDELNSPSNLKDFHLGFGISNLSTIKGLEMESFLNFNASKQNDKYFVRYGSRVNYDLRMSDWLNSPLESSVKLYLTIGGKAGHKRETQIETFVKLDLGVGIRMPFGRFSSVIVGKRDIFLETTLQTPESNFEPFNSVLFGLRYNFFKN